MKMRNRLIAAAALLLIVIFTGGMAVVQRWESSLPAELADISGPAKETVLIWYTDEALTDYISSAAVAFNEDAANQEYRILPVLVPGLEYLEAVNRESIAGAGPDLYLVAHDSLEKAYLAGLAAEIALPAGADFLRMYPEAGLNAVTYRDKTLGYPFFFETSALLYNQTYLTQMAEAQLQAEADVVAALAAESELAADGPAAENTAGAAEAAGGLPVIDKTAIESRIESLLPQTLADMKSVADTYDAPEQVEAVFKWDVTDIFYNYFFVGNSMVIGGEAGDNTANIDIYNPGAISSMKMYQNLSQFFAIDTNEIEYADIINDFIAGKLVFTVATTDVIATLEQAAAEGAFNYEYGIVRTPDIDETTPTRTLSMTSCAVVNGYSEHQEIANRFAVFLTKDQAGGLYDRSGKVAAARGVEFENAHLNKFTEEYARSIPLPKMIETSNFWVRLEIAFARIWDGANANQELKQLSEQIMTQVRGEPFTEEVIVEEVEETAIEYLDEEALTQEAQSGE